MATGDIVWWWVILKKNAKFGWNWPGGSGEEDFLNFVNLCSLFLKYLPLEKGGVLHLNKLESPSLMDSLCQVWLKLTQWFLRRIRKLEKFTDGQTDRQTPDERLSEKLTWAFSSGELKKVKMWQAHRQIDKLTDDGQQLTR